MALRSPFLLLLFAAFAIDAAAAQAPAPVWTTSVPGAARLAKFPLPPNAPGALGKTFSVELSLRSGALAQPGVLLRILGSDQQTALEAEVTHPALRDGAVQFQVTTDFRPQPLILAAPLRLLDRATPHNLLLRDLGFRIDLFVDGVLIDQEWPVGSVAATGTSLAEASSAVADVRIWSQALPDSVIEAQNGGKQAVARRDQRMLGPEQTSLQYWRPRGANTSAGDAMPFFHDGVLHVFFLLDRRHHHSKWGLGAHQWGHVSTTDLIHWKNYPAALTIEQEWEASICTGSVFFHDGKFYAFYATRMPDRSEHLGMAISDDGISFHKLLPSPFAEPAPPYRRGPNRDPFVFGDDHDFHMMATASLATPSAPDHAGALEHLTSSDLKAWKVEPAPFLVTGYAADPECSDLFLWHGWYYLLFSEGGQAHYRMSRSRSGPWTKPAPDVFDGVQARVMKTAAFSGDRRIGVAFVPDGDFAGHLLFRELLRSTDGTLRTTFPAEMTPHGTPLPTPEISAQTGEVDAGRGGATLHPGTTGASVRIVVPKNFILTATLKPGEHIGRFGFRFGDGSGANISTLAIEPARGRMAWTSAAPSISGPAPSIEGVADLEAPMQIQIIVDGTIVDLNANGRHTLVYRLPEKQGRAISLYTEGGDLTLKDLTTQSLGERP